MSHVPARALARSLEPSDSAGEKRAVHVQGLAPGGGQTPEAPTDALRDAHARASAIVAGIAADAAANPELYLRTTVVPEGGE